MRIAPGPLVIRCSQRARIKGARGRNCCPICGLVPSLRELPAGRPLAAPNHPRSNSSILCKAVVHHDSPPGEPGYFACFLRGGRPLRGHRRTWAPHRSRSHRDGMEHGGTGRASATISAARRSRHGLLRPCSASRHAHDSDRLTQQRLLPKSTGFTAQHTRILRGKIAGPAHCSTNVCRGLARATASLHGAYGVVPDSPLEADQPRGPAGSSTQNCR
jgi:hypothetical protein